MAVDADKDVQAAVVALWNNSVGLGLPDPAASGFKVGQITAGRTVGGSGSDPNTGQPIEYASIEVVKGKENQRAGTSGAYYDYRNVTLTVRGPEPLVSQALGYMLGTFSLKALMPTGTKLAQGQATLTLPSGARFWRWWPMGDGEKTIEDKQRAGMEIWKGVVRGEITVIRTDP